MKTNARLALLSSIVLIVAFALPSWAVAPHPGSNYPAVRTTAQETPCELPVEANPVLTELFTMTGSHWSGYARSDGIACWRLNGAGLKVRLPQNEQDAYAVALPILNRLAGKLFSEPVDFQPLAANNTGARWYIHFRQIAAGVIVEGATSSIRIDQAGRVTMIQLGIADPTLMKSFSGIGEASAMAAAKQICQGDATSAKPVWLLRDGDFQHGPLPVAAYVVDCDVASDNRPQLYIDATNGMMIAGSNRVNFDVVTATVTGDVHNRYQTDSLQSFPMPFVRVRISSTNVYADTHGVATRTITGSSLTATTTLYGRYADVRPNESTPARASVTRSGTGSVDVHFAAPPAMGSEPNLYYHMNFVHGFYKGLDPSITGFDNALPGRVGIPNYDNAYYNGVGIYFGDGGGTFNDFAMFCDVIYHEYTHGITDLIYPDGMLPYSGQSGAMNEAWSDYFACTITNEPIMGEGGLYRDSSQIMRNLINTKRYPGSWVGEVHADAEIVGAPMWRLRTQLGVNFNDSLIHYAKYAYAESFYDYFVDVLERDDDDGILANGTPHSAEIYAAFGDHGIGPGATPNLAVQNLIYRFDGLGGSTGNGDRYFDQNETMMIDFSVKNDLTLFPPPATNVTISLETADSGLTLPTPIQVAMMNAGDSLVTGPLMVTNTLATSRYLYLRIVRRADGGYCATDSIRLLAGKPSLAVISADTSSSLLRFVTNGLDTTQTPYIATKSINSGLTDSLLAEHNQIFLIGGASDPIITADQATALEAVLIRGGKVLISAQHLAALRAYPSLMNRLHFTIRSDSVNVRILDPEPNASLGAGRVYVIGGTGAYNQHAPDAIEPTEGAQAIYRYTTPDTGIAAVAYGTDDPQQARSIVFGFGIESIHKASNRIGISEVLNPILQWFNGVSSSPKPVAVELPHTFAIQAYPNPFNPTTQIHVTLPRNGIVTMTVSDILGRTVWTQQQYGTVGTNVTTFDGSQLASGLYFLHVNAAGGYRHTMKLTLMK